MVLNFKLKSLIRNTENGIAHEVAKIIRSLSSGDYLEALAGMDSLCELKNSDESYFVRATIRNLVMDLNGSLADLDKLSADTENCDLLRATVLSKMGKMDESISIIKKIGTKKGIGIAGRRMDLSLIGMTDGSVPYRKFAGWEVGCIAGHLLALAEWKQLEKILEFVNRADSKEYAQTFLELKECGALFDRGPYLGVTPEIEGIEGWFSPDEAEYIASLAKKVPAESNIVEIGSFCGRSTISLIFGSQKGTKPVVHSVDPHLGLKGIHPESTLPLFVNNLQRRNLLQYVVIHIYHSEDLAKTWDAGKVTLLFIDANHSFESVNKDFTLWCKHLMDGALVVFHDFPQEGPNKLIREILTSKPEFFPHSFMDSLFVFEYRPHAANVDLCRNAAFMKFLELMGRTYNYWTKSEEEISVKKSISILQGFTRWGDKN